jgi:serine/threonine protein phosphatase PrpC
MTEPTDNLEPGLQSGLGSGLETGQEPAFVSAAATDVGRVRKLNEDSHLDRPDLGLWAVADGMGGHQAGDLASQTIIEALGVIPPPRSARELMVEVRQALERANDSLLSYADQCHADRSDADGHGDRPVIASTVVCLLTFGGHYASVWAGDSRLYLHRSGEIIQVSHDHSVVQEMVDAGQIDSDAARRHPSSNQVTRAVGVNGWIDLEVVQDDLHPGDVFLLCSDGITRIIEDEEIGRILAGSDPAAAVRELIDLALDRGAPDNATAVVVRCEAVSEEKEGRIQVP